MLTHSLIAASILALGCTILSPDAWAQESVPDPPSTPVTTAIPDEALTSYLAEFFAQFAPRNALDMVLRVPGFALKTGNAEVRGFAQAAGNVVINGQRPSAKSDTLVEILERIPAGRVARIEIGFGAQFGADYAGEVQVANIVLTSTDGLSGNIAAALERNFTGRIPVSGDASANWVTGRHTLGVSASYQNGLYDEEGHDLIFRPGEALPIASRSKSIAIGEPKYSGSLSYAFDGETIDSGHLNLKYSDTGFDYQEDRIVVSSAPLQRDLFLSDYATDEFEIGGDVTLKTLGGTVELLVLHTRRGRLYDDLFIFDADSNVLDGFGQLLNDRRAESIARISHSRTIFSNAKLQTGVEAARNILTSQVDLTDLATGQRIDLPIDDVTVSENRAEAFVTLGFGVTSKLRAETGLRYETSDLSVIGDAEARRSLSFLKPNLSLFWDGPDSVGFQFSVERTVAQLQFEDFVSFAELKNDRINGGNADLLPQRAWEIKLTAERTLLGDGIARLTLEYNRITQLQDRVPVPGGFDAPGNLGTGNLWALDANLELPLDSIGIAGGRLSAQSSIILTSVRDPYTLEPRRFSGVPVSSVNLGFRKDGKQTAWGFEISGAGDATSFRLDELDTTLAQFPTVFAFYQWRPDKVSSITFSISNLFDATSVRRRVFFNPDRSMRDPALIEIRRSESHLVPRVSYKRTF